MCIDTCTYINIRVNNFLSLSLSIYIYIYKWHCAICFFLITWLIWEHHGKFFSCKSHQITCPGPNGHPIARKNTIFRQGWTPSNFLKFYMVPSIYLRGSIVDDGWPRVKYEKNVQKNMFEKNARSRASRGAMWEGPEAIPEVKNIVTYQKLVLTPALHARAWRSLIFHDHHPYYHHNHDYQHAHH